MRDVGEQMRRDAATPEDGRAELRRTARALRKLRRRLRKLARQARPARHREGHHRDLPRGPARAARRVHSDPTPKRFHDWRKQVKVLSNELRIVGRAVPELATRYLRQGREAGRDPGAGPRPRLRDGDGRAAPALVRVGRRVRGGARRWSPSTGSCWSARRSRWRRACSRGGPRDVRELVETGWKIWRKRASRRPKRSRHEQAALMARRARGSRRRRCMRGASRWRRRALGDAARRRSPVGRQPTSYRDGHTRPRALAFNPDDGLLYVGAVDQRRDRDRRSGRVAAARAGAPARSAGFPDAIAALPGRRRAGRLPVRRRACAASARRRARGDWRVTVAARRGRRAARAGWPSRPAARSPTSRRRPSGGVKVVSLAGRRRRADARRRGCRRARCAWSRPGRCRGRTRPLLLVSNFIDHTVTVHADRRRRAAGRRAARRSGRRRRCWT